MAVLPGRGWSKVMKLISTLTFVHVESGRRNLANHFRKADIPCDTSYSFTLAALACDDMMHHDAIHQGPPVHSGSWNPGPADATADATDDSLVTCEEALPRGGGE